MVVVVVTALVQVEEVALVRLQNSQVYLQLMVVQVAPQLGQVAVLAVQQAEVVQQPASVVAYILL